MDYNPFAPEIRQDPYPHYARLRREAPAYEIPGIGGYAISRYDDVHFALNHPEIFSSAGFSNMTINEKPTRMMIFTDPPDHTRLRNLVNRAFTPKMVADLEPRIRAVTGELIDAMAERGEGDLIADLAIPLPVTIIAEMLGVDPGHKDDFKRWSDWIVADFMNGVPEDRREAYDADMEAFKLYVDRAVEERLERPTDDLIGALVRAGMDGGALTAEEVLAFIVLLLVAGNETTTNLVGNAVVALTGHPEQLALLRADPSLLGNAVEEALRYDAPVQFLLRRATRDIELAGTAIAEGAMVMLLFGSANRDERRYAQGDRFDITQDASGHLAFGHGVHFCLGAPLARLEGRIALEALLSRFDELRREPGPVELVPAVFLRGPARLPLSLTPAAAGARPS